MREIEVKILEIDVAAVQRKLNKLGAKKVLDEKLYALFFDTPDSRLHKHKELVRLRMIGKDAFLTFKRLRTKKRFKITDELETKVESFARMKSIIEGLGFRVTKRDTKRRISYTLHKSRIELDIHDDIPAYLEIESPR